MTIVQLHPELHGTFQTEGDRWAVKESALADYSGGLTLKKCASIGERCMVFTHTHKYHQKYWQDLAKENQAIPKPLIIEEYAFIGAGAIILPGVNRIGKCAIVGAGSVITKEVPDNEIWAGNPAHKIGDVQ